MPEKPTFYITTAISYPNAPPHIGHAYEAIATDVIARFKRLDGYDVMFLTGTDEHGLKIQQAAEKQGLTPAQIVDQIVPLFQGMLKAIDGSNDDFLRTTQDRHKKACSALWQKMDQAGDIYLDKYAGWYSVRDEAYYTESELTKDGNGNLMAPTGAPVEWVEEASYFFRLSNYRDKLLDWYRSSPHCIMPPERYNEVVSFVKTGLKDISISRTSLKWGVPVPGDSNHVMYVWVDALTNYLTALGYPDTDNEKFKKFWPADLHIIGKDIIRFHAVYWPAFLMSAGLALPGRIFGHGFLFNKGEKMSKSVGNVISPSALIDEYGVDPVRYFFMREVPYGKDGSYSHKAIINRVNADLANDLGNLAQRSLVMIAKNCDGRIPEPAPLADADHVLLADTTALLKIVREHMETQALHQILTVIWKQIADCNRYFAAQEPWSLKKTDPGRMGSVLYVTIEVLRQVAILLQPVMPASAGKLLNSLAVEPGKRDFADLSQPLQAGARLPPPEPVFPRYQEKEDA